MSEKVLIQQCSPTLAGLKTGNMFSCDFETAAEMKKWLREWNKKLSSQGLRFLPLRYRNPRALIYVYRPSRLKNDLEHRQAREILCSRGSVAGCNYQTKRHRYSMSSLLMTTTFSCPVICNERPHKRSGCI